MKLEINYYGQPEFSTEQPRVHSVLLWEGPAELRKLLRREVFTVDGELSIQQIWKHHPNGQVKEEKHRTYTPTGSCTETYTFDTQGRRIRFEDSSGCWTEFDYNETGQIIEKRKSNGQVLKTIAFDEEYDLRRVVSEGSCTYTYTAGCRVFTLAEALAHWNPAGGTGDASSRCRSAARQRRAELFYAALLKEQGGALLSERKPVTLADGRVVYTTQGEAA